MALDLLSGKESSKSWSRGDGANAWLEQKALRSVTKKIPWVPLAIVGGGLGLLFLLPRRQGQSAVVREPVDDSLSKTTRIPRESMKNMVFGGSR